jgi:hypothetical protein
MPAGLPDLVNIPAPRGPDPAEYVGPGLWGAIYRSKARTAYYRVLLTRDAPIESMQGARDWSESPARPAIAPVTDVNIWFEEDCNYSCVRYAATGALTLQEVLQTSPPADRIHYLAQAVRCLTTWRNFAGSNLSPMPAEIVFSGSGAPLLLASPFRPALNVDDILACPARALFVSPEGFRGATSLLDDTDSLHVFIAMAALALHRPPDLPPDEAILHGANRTLLAPATLQSTLPRWMEKLDAIQQMRNEVFRLLAAPPSERGAVDPDDFASRLEDWARRCDPIIAVMMLHQGGRLEEACNLLREILGYEESHGLLMLGAQLAEIRRSPLEGIEYLERAISSDAERKDALAFQVQLVARNPELSRAEPGQEPPELWNRLKSTLFRDFNGLPVNLQQQLEHEVAQFLIARAEFDEAANWIFPRLFDEKKIHLWWKFDMALDYAEALMGSGSPAARDALAGVRIGIDKATVQHSVSKDVLEECGQRLRALEQRQRLNGLRRQQPGGGS